MIKRIMDALMRRTPAERPDSAYRIVYMPQTQAGVWINPDNALTYSAVWASTRIIAETIASLSWHVMEKGPSGKKIRDDSFVDRILHTQANGEMSAGTFRETLLGHALLWGNGYAEIERDGAGRPQALWPLPPDQMCPERLTDGRLVYVFRPRVGGEVALLPRDVFHLKGFGFDGLQGYSVVRMAAQSMGLGVAMERNAASFFGNGSRPGGLLKYPGKITPEIREETRKEWMRQHSGPQQSHKVAVLDQGLEFVPMSIPNEDAQLLESRKFQTTEIARWFRVPPHKLADLERATFSNIAEQSIEFVTDTIMPWVTRLEDEANIKLFGNRATRMFTKININALMRGDPASRAQYYQIMSGLGALSVNDIRELEDLNPIGPDGDKRLVPMNMQLLEKVGEEPEPSPEPLDDEDEEEDGDSPVPNNRLNGQVR